MTAQLDALDWKPCVNGCIEKSTGEARIANHGRFCGREFGVAKAALRIAPDLIEHMVSLKTSSAKAGEKVDSSRNAPAPGNEQAMNDSHETYRRLVYWSALWANRIHITAPGPAIGVWRDNEARVVGLPADVSPGGAKFVAKIMTAWLELNLDSILRQDEDDVNFWLDDLRDVFRLNARWPREQRPFYAKTPCPDDAGRIAVYPPRWEGDDIKYKCETCGRIFTEDRFEYYTRLFAEIETEDDPVKRRLMRKYAT